MTDLKTLRGLAHLARLDLAPEREAKMLADLNEILAWVEKLGELDTTGVEPLVYLSDNVNVTRPDVAHNSVAHADALRNAPRKDSDYFRVPKVLE
ncbi:MAG: Asp-tRNA(Asn)/Glu-tRNA(Gln) amidotransferase subunit GatC [Hymenobacteraceae bacterium]|nr:Asp-tRNA(Asn)/Glu-tRNA(Gln) amidotransferase subunit GatC [Hymenobacteraceae bacterium]